MRIGYFGGSFDPPHRGHLAVARAARDRFALDRVLLAPTARQPFKPEGPVASWPDRLRMTELLCENEPRLEASAIDGPQPNNAPNYTVDTLRRLKSQLPADTRIFAILGADAFQHISKWREPDALLDLAEWVIVSRPDYPLPSALLSVPTEQHLRVHLLEGPADRTSATDLRSRLARNTDPSDMLPKAVRDYIQRHGLYRPDESCTR